MATPALLSCALRENLDDMTRMTKMNEYKHDEFLEKETTRIQASKTSGLFFLMHIHTLTIHIRKRKCLAEIQVDNAADGNYSQYADKCKEVGG